MKIIIKLEGYLKYKYPSNILELNYSKPVTIRQVLEDAKISSADVFFIKVGDLIVKEDYLLTKSNGVIAISDYRRRIEEIRNLINYGAFLPRRNSKEIF